MSIAFLLYLTPGLTNTKYANLKLLSRISPPLFYSLYDKGLEMESIRDFDEALELAKASGKPIMIDFTGWACKLPKNGRTGMDDSEINKIISEKYVLVSLYVDDREELPEDQNLTSWNPLVV